MTKFFVNPDGGYIGGFDMTARKRKALLPAGAIEVASPPDDARQIWGFPGWTPPPVDNRPLDAEELFDLLKAKAIVSDADRPRPRPVR